MARLKLVIIPVLVILLVGFVLAESLFERSTPSIFNKDSPSLQQPVKYGQYRYTHYDPRVINYYRLNEFVYLTPVEEPMFKRGMHPFYPRGTVRVISSRSPLLPKGQIQIKVKDLGSSSRTGLAYEGWLFDEGSGYALSVGVFRTVGFGTGALEWRTEQYIDHYDYFFITEEAYPDYDPRPGPVLLQGRIPKRDYFYEREFAPVKKAYGYALT